jgi:hypothetical protein
MLMIGLIVMAGCANQKVTGYNVKTTVGQTDYDNGQRALYTGASVDVHVEVK